MIFPRFLISIPLPKPSRFSGPLISCRKFSARFVVSCSQPTVVSGSYDGWLGDPMQKCLPLFLGTWTAFVLHPTLSSPAKTIRKRSANKSAVGAFRWKLAPCALMMNEPEDY